VPDEPFAPLDACLDQVAEQQEEPDDLSGYYAVVLVVEEHFARVEVVLAGGWNLFAGTPLVVDDLRRRQIGHPPASLPQPEAVVQFLRVHEEILVQAPDLLRGFRPQHDARSYHPVDALLFVVGAILHVVAAGGLVAWEPLLQEGALQEGGCQRWETAARGLDGAIGIQDAGTQGTHVRVLVHPVDHGSKRSRPHFRIRVQQQQVATLGQGQALVVGLGEASVGIVGHQANPGMVLPDHGHAAVGRGVVYHDGLAGIWAVGQREQVSNRLGSLSTDAFQAAGEQFSHVPIDDDDGEVARCVSHIPMLLEHSQLGSWRGLLHQW